ncbi:uncharacterized protein LOC129351363 [Poeciliopsis prolifica]|uniref:uncharacterized protein LOC129351363 n=1 Tax=Poeciliopsis prolifica TaxID=188132 RepID=UPI0024146765|nr:uncharacterized protein LOC129351363 [Poeciliopsis prolifica]
MRRRPRGSAWRSAGRGTSWSCSGTSWTSPRTSSRTSSGTSWTSPGTSSRTSSRISSRTSSLSGQTIYHPAKAMDQLRKEGDDCLKSQTQTASSSSDGRSPGRFQVSEAQSAIHLSIRVLKDSSISILSKTVVKKCPLVSLKCPLGLQELDFLSLLRSAVPQLAADDKPFHIWTLDKRRRLQRLTLSTVTPEEIVRNVKSTRLRKPTVYIRLKTKKEIQEEIPSLQMEKSSAMLVSEEMRKSSQHRRETEDDPLMRSVSGDDSTAPPAAQMDGDAADGNEGETNRSNSSWKLDVSDEREKQNPKLMNEKEEVNPSEDVWTETGFSCKVCKTQKSEVAVIKHAWRHMEETGSVCGVCGESGEASKDRFHSEHRTDDSPETAIPGQSSLSLSDPLKVHSGQQPVQPEVSSFVSGLPLENKHKLVTNAPPATSCLRWRRS